MKRGRKDHAYSRTYPCRGQGNPIQVLPGQGPPYPSGPAHGPLPGGSHAGRQGRPGGGRGGPPGRGGQGRLRRAGGYLRPPEGAERDRPRRGQRPGDPGGVPRLGPDRLGRRAPAQALHPGGLPRFPQKGRGGRQLHVVPGEGARRVRAADPGGHGVPHRGGPGRHPGAEGDPGDKRGSLPGQGRLPLRGPQGGRLRQRPGRILSPRRGQPGPPQGRGLPGLRGLRRGTGPGGSTTGSNWPRPRPGSARS